MPNVLKHLVGRRGDDCKRVRRALRVGVDPGIPHPGHSKRPLLAFEVNEVGLTEFSVKGPLDKRVSQYEAALASNGLSKAWLLDDSLGSSVPGVVLGVVVALSACVEEHHLGRSPTRAKAKLVPLNRLWGI